MFFFEIMILAKKLVNLIWFINIIYKNNKTIILIILIFFYLSMNKY